MTTNDKIKAVVTEYRSLLGDLLDETSFGEYVSSFHHAKIENWLQHRLEALVRERDDEWRTHLNVVLGTQLYQLHKKHFTPPITNNKNQL